MLQFLRSLLKKVNLILITNRYHTILGHMHHLERENHHFIQIAERFSMTILFGTIVMIMM